MLVRLTNKNKPFYVNTDHIVSIQGDSYDEASLSEIRLRDIHENEEDQYGVLFADISPDEVFAEIVKQQKCNKTDVHLSR